MVRQRHPPGAYRRETHTLSPVDYAQPSDRMYGSEMDLEAVTVVDLGQGSVTDGAIVDGGLDGGSLIRAGTLPSSSLDTTPPPLPTSVVASSELAVNADGTSSVSIVVQWQPPVGGWPDDYFGTYVYVTNDSDNDPLTPAPVWTRPIVVAVGKDVNGAVITGVPGATDHWVQLRTVDVVGNYSTVYEVRPSGWPVTTLSDVDAPGIPQAIQAVGGYKGMGVHWQAASDPDLMFYEVRYAPAADSPPTHPDTTQWVTIRTGSNTVGIDGLPPGFYYVAARAVDFSKNVAARWSMTGLASTDVLTCIDHGFVNGDRVAFDGLVNVPELSNAPLLYVVNATATTFQVSATVGGAVVTFTVNCAGFVGYDPDRAVNYLADDEAGWSALGGPAEAKLIGSTDAYFGTIISNIIATQMIDASTIDTGVLKISSSDTDSADGIQIIYGTDKRVIGEWNENYLDVRSKTADRRLLDFIRLDGGTPGDTLRDGPRVAVWKDGNEVAAITKDGINATAINFGVSPGGHNLIFNSSFELSKFLLTNPVSIGTGGNTFAGGVGGWGLVGNTNGTLAAGAISMAAL